MQRINNGLYGIARAGKDIIVSFCGWLVMNKWASIPEDPVVHVFWHIEDEATVMRRAVHLKKYVESELTKGQNPLAVAAEFLNSEPWKAKQRTREGKFEGDLAYVKGLAGNESKCAVLATYVDDCSLDAKKGLRNLVWAVIRTYFESDVPTDVQRFLGVVHVPVNVPGQRLTSVTRASGCTPCPGTRCSASPREGRRMAVVRRSMPILGLQTGRLYHAGMTATPATRRTLASRSSKAGS